MLLYLSVQDDGCFHLFVNLKVLVFKSKVTSFLLQDQHFEFFNLFVNLKVSIFKSKGYFFLMARPAFFILYQNCTSRII